MLEIYHGDGKGKTTAAAGLALRAAGNGAKVIFVQFLKDGSSGELRLLEKEDNICVMHADTFYGFTKNMTAEQKNGQKESYTRLLDNVFGRYNELCRESFCVLVFDEILHAIKADLVDENAFSDRIRDIKGDCELVLTGREPSQKLLEMADYVTYFKKEKHPYDKGIAARKYIEF